MNLEPSTILTVVGSVAGIAGTWAVLGYRIRQLEAEAAENKTMRQAVVALDAKLETIRTVQGQRLGVVEDDTAVLKGKFDGFQVGFGAGRRSRTAAHGHPIEKGLGP